jgi:hypothetical protein
MERIKFILLFLVTLLAFGVNAPDTALMRLGVEKRVVFATLIAIVVSLLMVRRHILLVLLTLALAIGANMPAEFAEHAGYNRDYMLAALLALLVIPTTFRHRSLY